MTLTLHTRILLVVLLCATLASAPLYFISDFSKWYALGTMLTILCVSFALARYLLKDYKEGISALETGLLNLKDGEYSTSLAYSRNDEFGHLSALYNDTVSKLRREKHWLFQRELLLDKVTQSSPDVLMLLNDQQQVVFSNIAARDFFNSTHALEGLSLSDLLSDTSGELKVVIENSRDGLFSMRNSAIEQETWHLSNGQFRLNNQPHRLIILKQMTRELSRQEVAVWKKVIRIISHELNNSLGPISSMLHSGQILAQRLEEEKLSRVFATIEERIHHLTEFVQGYGKFAKLPEPKIEPLDFLMLANQLKDQWTFGLDADQHAYLPLQADPIQLEQLLINLLKNAHESESPKDEITISAHKDDRFFWLEVKDRGKGMSDTVMSNALIPFYSTKSQGSGLGLALCREIVDAHHGQISLRNRENGGLAVRVLLPVIA